MSEMLFAAIVFTLGCYVLSMALCLLRLVRGPVGAGPRAGAWT